jgi:murein DD-endopeptidase MepM/ murein hydrolase activator NlpD
MHHRRSAGIPRVGLAACAAAPRRSCVAHRAIAACGVAGVALALTFATPVTVHAGWPLGSAGEVQLRFGSLYASRDGASSQHRGVDLAAAPGAQVLAPLSGQVSFAGSVPGVGGGRVMAVTIETASGKVTLMPLARVGVTRGTQVSEGASVGTLASDGDGSTAETHLHVGVRVGDLYVDPLTVIAVPVPTDPTPGTDSVGSGVRATSGSGAHVAGGAPVPGTLGAGVSLAHGEHPAQGLQDGPAAGQLAPGVSIARRGSAAAGMQAGSQVAPSAPRVTRAGAAATRPVFSASEGVVMVPGTSGSAQTQAGGLGPAQITAAAEWLARAAKRVARTASLVLAAVLLALGALWPLWRGSGRKGAGKVLVSAGRDDVAAASGR